MNPTARSIRHLRESGWTVARVEYWLAPARRRIDVWAFGDLLACRPEGRPTLFQVTTGSNVAARITKARANAGPLLTWLLSGGKLVVHGWSLRGKRGERKLWTLREVEIGVEQLTAREQLLAAT